MSRGEAVAGWGLLVCAFATGVLFAQTAAPVVFAGWFATNVTNAATGWFVLGAVLTLVGWLRA